MKLQNLRKTYILSVFALGAALSASAQTAAMATSGDGGSPVVSEPGPGLVGTNYSELSFGYQNLGGTPGALRDYEFLSNAAVYREGIWGGDANFQYDHLNGGGDGYSNRRDRAMLGLTGYLNQSWGRPFVTADAGYAWQRAGNISERSFAYALTGGVQFQVLPAVSVSPFIEYDAEPHLYNRLPATANFPDHVVDYGAKATYRLTRQWSLSGTAMLDQYSGRDFGLRGGVDYRF
ncbi:MAG TPA: hypothetical protein VFE25_03775 [Opitutaceae bacterium]|jgi:hypothetical protein|nr:hypothetical protein [Opitutaceae bacterium]